MPFASISGRQTYFSFEALEQRLGLLRGLMNSRDKIILVIGEQGIGKTTFLSQFLQISQLKWKNCRLQLGGETSIASIHTGCVYVLHSNPYPTILIDDAHLLKLATLKSLLNKFVINANDGLINRLILFGDPSIIANLSGCLPSLSDNTAVSQIHLPAMDRAETSQYLHRLMSIAGISPSRLLSRRVLNKIYRSTGGVPGLINNEAEAWLQKKNKKGTFTPNGNKSSGASRLRELFKEVSIATDRLKLGTWINTIRSENSSRSKKESSFNNRAMGLAKTPDNHLSPASSRNKKDSPQRMGDTLRSGLNPLPPDQTEINLNDIHREEWLLCQDPKCFTLQVLGVKTEAALAAIVKAHKFFRHREIACFSTIYKGEKAFPLLWGIYQTRTEASAAIKDLPDKLKTFYPLVRRMYSIQQSIHSNDPN